MQRQRVRDEVLGTKLTDFHAFADYVEAASTTGRVVVMGSQQTLRMANEERNDWLKLQKVM
ncbi:MAG: hypothetical protein R2867_21795 [Caldilineaceae bacterium]